jgi:hypothetical protein
MMENVICPEKKNCKREFLRELKLYMMNKANTTKNTKRTRFTNSRIDVDKEQLVFLYSKNVNNTIMLKRID